ncbi:hypothetical protein BOX15_Mlig013655g1 [Macrostomum lignano]|uniref:EF-hand domain-containing protein n=1 Tax=Macrostomum lignano TaxID=282301 RepID=A0A267EW55_9PLAT|nr:hypothetical protein BOX15_Mlig013655g1 [Macrostomum lignano]
MQRAIRYFALIAMSWLGLISLPTVDAAKRPRPTPTTVPMRKLCLEHGGADWIFTKSFSIGEMLHYCETLAGNTATLQRVAEQWPSISDQRGACYNPDSWTFQPGAYSFLLRAIFRHHIDVNLDGKMSWREMRLYLEPALRYRLLPGLLDDEYRSLLDAHFRGSRTPRMPISEAEFVSAALRMLRAEWPLLVKRTIPDLDGDNCVTRAEFARADCRRRIKEVDLYFRVADLDGNRAVTGPELMHFRDTVQPQPGEESGAQAFNAFFGAVQGMIDSYKEDYYHKTSYAHDQMITFNEINLYICDRVI